VYKLIHNVKSTLLEAPPQTHVISWHSMLAMYMHVNPTFLTWQRPGGIDCPGAIFASKSNS